MRCQRHVPQGLSRLLSALTQADAEVVLILADAGPAAQQFAGSGIRIGYAAGRQTRQQLFRAGLKLLGRPEALSQLILCDDSFVALNPTQLLAQTAARAAQLDLAALTMLEAPEPCLQSYWLSFAGQRAVSSAAFSHWWYTDAGDSDVALTRHFLGAGYRVGSLLRLDRSERIVALCRAHACGALPVASPQGDTFLLDPAAAGQLDPTMFAWDRLLAEFGVVALRLVEENPSAVNIVKLRSWIAAAPGVAPLFETHAC